MEKLPQTNMNIVVSKASVLLEELSQYIKMWEFSLVNGKFTIEFDKKLDNYLIWGSVIKDNYEYNKDTLINTLIDFLNESNTWYQQSHFWLMTLLEHIVEESNWCSKEEFRDACDTYKFNFIVEKDITNKE